MTTPVAAAPNRTLAFTTAFFEELARAGVRDVCLCPGSRSTPLVAAIARQPALRCWTHIDERAGAFFALGLAKTRRAPVALVCTSGTAAANFLPAVVEAHHTGVPLLVLTADRPPELRDWGAGQTIDQLHLYGRNVRWFVEVAVPAASGGRLRYARALANRAVGRALGSPPGPVHLNFPFRKPLDPVEIEGDVPADLETSDPLAAAGRAPHAYSEVVTSAAVLSDARLAAIAEIVRGHERGVIACGPMDAAPGFAAAVSELARRAGWPLLAEPTAQLRRGPHVVAAPVIAASDLFLREPTFAQSHLPTAVLRFGATPTSASQQRWLERAAPEHFLLVDPEGAWNDPDHLASLVLQLDPVRFCEDLGDRLAERSAPSTTWCADFERADRLAEAAIERETAGAALLEPRAVRELARALPDAAILYVSNSMPVRDLDDFLPKATRPLRVLSNRGANGIDGMVSSALGAAAAALGPVVLLTGDLAFLHDAGGLLAAHRHGLSATLVVLDNDGGGIFSFLPIAAYAEAVDFESNFRTPHDLDLGPVAEAFGARVYRVGSWEDFDKALAASIGAPGVDVLIVPIDRDASVDHHRVIEAAVAAAISEPANGSGAR